jgi:hypothetical protein
VRPDLNIICPGCGICVEVAGRLCRECTTARNGLRHSDVREAIRLLQANGFTSDVYACAEFALEQESALPLSKKVAQG